MWRNRLTTVAAIVTTTVMLLVFGLFLAANDTLERMVDALGRRTNMVVYLRDDASPIWISQTIAEFQSRPDVAEVIFVTKEQAADDLRASLSELGEVLDVIGQNPLPASIEVRMEDPVNILELAEALRHETDQIEEVLVRADVIERLLNASQLITIGGGLMIALLALVALLVIVNTIRLAVHSRREEIEVMKLLGATDWFVRGPFLIEGAVIGLIGSVVAAFLTLVIYIRVVPVVNSLVSFLPVRTAAFFWVNLALFIVLMGLIIGTLGSYFSVRNAQM
jgi:cell division transport system permease protein